MARARSFLKAALQFMDRSIMTVSLTYALEIQTSASTAWGSTDCFAPARMPCPAS